MNGLKLAEESIYLYSHGYLETLSKARSEALTGRNAGNAVLKILYTTYKEFMVLFLPSKTTISFENKVIGLVNSKNNYDAIKYLKKDPNYKLVKIAPNNSQIAGLPHIVLKQKFFYSLLFLCCMPYLLMTNNRRYILLLHQAFGTTFSLMRILKKNRPKAIIFTNDHTPLMRSYLLAGRLLGIKTIYIQHAAVSKFFPPLEFDLSLLDGKISEDIYDGISKINGDVKFVGVSKLDDAISILRMRSNIKIIGIAVNQNDDFAIVTSVIDGLILKGYSIILRKHPLDTRNFIYNNKVENGNIITVFEFIDQSDFIIASDSSIHVEANSLKCRSIYYMFHSNKEMHDYYKFVKSKFIDEVINVESLLNYIENFNYSNFDFESDIFKYYNAVIGTKNYGHSARLIKEAIDESFIKQNRI